MRQKIYSGLFAVVTTLALLSFMACPDPSIEPRENGNVDVIISSPRTLISPQTLLPENVNVNRYAVSFEPKEGQNRAASIDTLGNTATATLEVGDWIISVTGYEGAVPLIKGEKTINVTRQRQAIGISVTQPVQGAGSLAYTVDGLTESEATNATLSISRISTSTSSITRDLLVSGGASGTIDQETGFYRVITEVTAGEARIVRYEIAHIYPQKTTAYDLEFTAADFHAYTLSGTVDLRLGSGPAPLAAILYFYLDAGHTTLLGSDEIVNGLWTATIPDLYGSRTLFPVIEVVDEWGSAILGLPTMTAPSDSTGSIDLGTFYARGTEDFSFTTAEDEDSKLVLDSPDPYPLSQGAGESVVIRLSVAGNIAVSNVHWLVDGQDTGIEGTEFTLVATDYAPNMVHYLAAEILLNGAWYSRELRFRVMGPEDLLPANLAYYVQAEGNDANAGTSDNAPFKTLAHAIDMASRTRIKTIVVAGTLNSESENGYSDQEIFSIANTGQETITIQGKSIDERGMLTGIEGKRVMGVDITSTLILGENLVITGGKSVSGGAGIQINQGTVILEGAEITGNVTESFSYIGAGGVCVASGAHLVMNKGSINENATFSANAQGDIGGGIAVDSYGSVSINGGGILNNIARTSGHGADAGGAVWINDGGLFRMSAGTIAGNTASASYPFYEGYSYITTFVAGGGTAQQPQRRR
jgi:hypothetical protein